MPGHLVGRALQINLLDARFLCLGLAPARDALLDHVGSFIRPVPVKGVENLLHLGVDLISYVLGARRLRQAGVPANEQIVAGTNREGGQVKRGLKVEAALVGVRRRVALVDNEAARARLLLSGNHRGAADGFENHLKVFIVFKAGRKLFCPNRLADSD